jgi:hypothetical protein
MAIIGQSAALAATAVSLNPTVDTPTETLTVSGSAFGDLEAVDVYLDTSDVLLLVTSSTGAFSGSITIPASALPGTHYVTAIRRKSGDAAQAALTVGNPWNQFGDGMARRAWNPYENVISTSSVSSLGQVWIKSNNSTGATDRECLWQYLSVDVRRNTVSGGEHGRSELDRSSIRVLLCVSARDERLDLCERR